MLFRSYHSWVAADPHLLLFTFLPPLLTGDAMTIDTHVARRCAHQCLLLAGPGVVIGALLAALVMYGALPYGWDFTTCLMVGSILAATDPVAVVSLLKELGASPVLTILIQGEALLNDGIAIVLFTVAYNIAGGEPFSPLSVFSFLTKSTLGAACVGLVIGVLFYVWILANSDKLCHSSPLIQSSLTMMCAYWSFIVAEGVFHMSGVLSTVTAALVLAHKMWPVLVERKAMLEFWHLVETIGNAIVFFLAGVLTGRATLTINLEATDWLWLLFVYVAITAIRFGMMLVFLPLLNRVGEAVSLQDAVVMTWGGLRGMVGLCLAILVQKDLAGGKLTQLDGDRILFLVGCIAALTLIVNATTSPGLTRVLGITGTPEGRTVLIRNIARRAGCDVKESMQAMMTGSQAAKLCAPGLVLELVDRLVDAGHSASSSSSKASLPPKRSTSALSSIILPSEKSRATMARNANLNKSFSNASLSSAASRATVTLRKLLHRQEIPPQVDVLWQNFERAKLMLLNTGAPIAAFRFGRQLPQIRQLLSDGFIDTEQLEIVREVFLEAVRAFYWEQLHSGRFDVGGSEPPILFSSINMAKDHCRARLADWEILKRDIGFASQREEISGGKSVMKASNAKTTSFHHLSEGWCSTLWRWQHKLRTKYNFRQQARAIKLINAFIDAHVQAQLHIASYFGESEAVDSPEEAFVIIESQIEVFEAARLRSMIGREVQMKVNTVWYVHCLAEQYRDFVIRVHEAGILKEKEAESLLHPVSHCIREINKERTKIYESIETADAVNRRKVMSSVEAAMVIQRCLRKRRMRRRASRIGTDTAMLAARLAAAEAAARASRHSVHSQPGTIASDDSESSESGNETPPGPCPASPEKTACPRRAWISRSVPPAVI
mmetsp:Transcript_100671/g.305501  ORF Transcript_100671/g.305501 Transcript_100671/m.305501 type:complete len:891 (-) Transcript_100671:47-2719(-)